jgi:hypothetical protein
LDSPTAQVSLSPASNVFPGNARGFSGDNAAGTPLDFCGPGYFHVGRMLGRGVIQAGQEFGRDIGALVEGQRESLAQKFLRS